MHLFTANEKAFRDFIQEHQPRVYNTALNILRNEQDAEEITQDVFVEAYNKAHTFKGESQVSTWLYRITTNKCIDHLRSKKRKKRFAFLTALFHESGEPVSDASDFVHPGIVTENKEKAAILYKAIEQLPETQKVAFLLSETSGLSYGEISEILAVSVSSIESLLFRARKNLRKILAGYYKNEKR
jgi:RNA polymerase sigma-70 factor (ECF subfamily)